MQSDELIWSVINHQFCSYKVKTETQNFCRNQYNVSGFCSRQSCPLANSRYATVRELEGGLFLFVKTIERAHSPKHMWEKIPLSHNYAKALEQIDNELIYWPKFLIHKCKQRTTKITQYLIKLRKLRQMELGKRVTKKPKLEKREARREAKALTAAQLEKSLEKELVARLKSKAYGDAPLNVNEQVWQAVLAQDNATAKDLQLEEDLDDQDLLEDEEELELEGDDGGREFVEDFEETDDEDLEDLDGFEGGDFDDFSDLEELDDDEDGEEGKSDAEPDAKGKRKAPSRRPQPLAPLKRTSTNTKQNKKQKGNKRVEIEYEMEGTGPLREKVAAW